MHDGAMSRFLLLAVLIVGQAPAVWAQPSPAAADRQAGEVAEADPARRLDILEAALRFYRPSGTQSRWIDGALLPETPGAPEVRLPVSTVDLLVERLGRGKFCAGDAREACRFRQGGRLRVSAPYLTEPTRARVVVEFESIWPFGPSIVSHQSIWLQQESNGWRIERRRGAE